MTSNSKELSSSARSSWVWKANVIISMLKLEIWFLRILPLSKNRRKRLESLESKIMSWIRSASAARNKNSRITGSRKNSWRMHLIRRQASMPHKSSIALRWWIIASRCKLSHRLDLISLSRKRSHKRYSLWFVIRRYRSSTSTRSSPLTRNTKMCSRFWWWWMRTVSYLRHQPA